MDARRKMIEIKRIALEITEIRREGNRYLPYVTLSKILKKQLRC